MASRAELTLEAQLDIARIPYEREVQFTPPRKFRADFMVGASGFVKDHFVNRLLIEVDVGDGSTVVTLGVEAWKQTARSRHWLPLLDTA